MARLAFNRRKKIKILVACCSLWIEIMSLVSWFTQIVRTIIALRICMCPTRPHYKMLYSERDIYMRRLVYESNETCLEQLRMNKSTFVNLCLMLKMDGKLKASKYLQVDEQVAIFLYILAHHVKNRVVKFHFRRSG